MATLAQRPRIGLKDVKYAVYNEATSTYGAVTSLTNAMELSFDRASSASTLFADDGPAFSAETVGEMNVSFGVADLLPAVYAELLGHTYANGIVVENVTDQSPYVAIGGKLLRAGKDGSDTVYEYFWLPLVKLNKPNTEAMTKGASIEYQTPTMEGRVVKNSSGVYKTSIRTDDPAVAAGTLSSWFTAPVESASVSLTAVTVGTITGNDTANTITIPFAKSGETFSLKTISDYDITVSVVSTGLLIAGTSTYAYSAAGVAPTITITNSNIGAVEYLVTVTNDVRDNNNVAVTPLSQLVTPA